MSITFLKNLELEDTKSLLLGSNYDPSNTYFGVRKNFEIKFWLSPSCAQTSLKLPSLTSNLSSRRILLALTSLQEPENAEYN